jgi:predicted CoA-substrate-specific enzyme activase
LNSLDKPAAIGLDIGSSYVKAVRLGPAGAVACRRVQRTGYDIAAAVSSLLDGFTDGTPALGVTGYGRSHWPGTATMTEISSLARAAVFAGVIDGTIVDIGGQDSKVLRLRNGKLVAHALNRPCAAGTGSYLEFIAQRLGLGIDRLNGIAGTESAYHPLNSFCTVFAATEILDCVKQHVPLPRLVRGLYAAIVERVRGIGSLESPLFLCGGVIAHHPVLADVFRKILGPKAAVSVLPEPQFLAAWGAALFAAEKQGKDAMT